MLGSIPADLLPIDDSGTRGPAGRLPAPFGPASPPHEPAASPPLLRDERAGLVEDGPDPWDEPTVDDAGHDAAHETVQDVVSQLAPIRSQASLADSYAREANPNDPVVRAAYACVWADLGLAMMLGTTRRARHEAALARGRRLPR